MVLRFGPSLVSLVSTSSNQPKLATTNHQDDQRATVGTPCTDSATSLVKYANTLPKHKVLVASDFPLIRPDRWLDDVKGAEYKSDARP